ncbi:LOW QUALITY PROTEIN: hypothetical protein MXB_5080 [Myxobolus squamalis]|nr:LOW QUALITY PROTEIN: hypothetical protein MXB_5080 [Myxobolus squamalis]
MTSECKKRKVIIDTDVGLDDAETIIYLTACKDLEIMAITIVAGNSTVEVTSKHAEKILGFLNCDCIPIYKSDSFSKLIESDGYFGSNAFANIELPATNKSCESNMKAPLAMIHYARKYPKEVHFICIGPMTNVALAFLLDNEFPSFVGSLTIMGGDSSETTYMNKTPHSEFNIHCDPLAFRIIGDCFSDLICPIMLIDWSFCWKNLLSHTMFPRLFGSQGENKKKNKHIELLSIIRDTSNEIIKRSFWEKGFLTADLFAAFIFHDPSKEE